MPRKPRVYLPGIPTHVIQRGNDRAACFFAEDDYRYYLQALDKARLLHDVAIHAYVLMTNHVHLLMTPTHSDSISRLMQSLGRRYVQYINTTYRRSGTLWEGRHKASLVQADDYLLTCYRYIEMNPVRAQMVEHPGDYPWSSYRHHAYGGANRMDAELLSQLIVVVACTHDSMSQFVTGIFTPTAADRAFRHLTKPFHSGLFRSLVVCSWVTIGDASDFA